MIIYEQIKAVLDSKINQLLTSSDVKAALVKQFDSNPASVILSGYCYNRMNNGAIFNHHLFEYVNRGIYKYLGECYPYTGLIFHRPKGSKEDIVVGEWKSGIKTIYKQSSYGEDGVEFISKEQMITLYEEYNKMLRYEMSLLNCQPTELRHLIGRIGEFLCAIHTNGHLSRQTNQHGFDVISKGRRISVKTTAQTNGFITVNQNTFSHFDDFFIVHYLDGEFKVVYYGPKEELLDIARTYNNKLEIDLKRLKKQTQACSLNFQ
ncbi:DUF6998 domain-containing protein [Bacillus badius]|uniref:DUF7225 domain-containing protein n=1 Tax=Bacillus badius TaxID=1455 RepID=UPI0005970C19|nr:hypothetical protein [Bacillus badius]KIL76062.1 hypothetical protein SD78_0164 [Bacillus badius]